ncbi:unnamed protein product [Nesidiocoris tenuis]|uniref:Uncharacterized protein n=1 Tax=Nesidiocoris tenuis TaxID=355587 RepID=A0A6H5GCT8_9HEMI|nr:unnamed protein product [Nesidiocoris tenuis]
MRGNEAARLQTNCRLQRLSWKLGVTVRTHAERQCTCVLDISLNRAITYVMPDNSFSILGQSQSWLYVRCSSLQANSSQSCPGQFNDTRRPSCRQRKVLIRISQSTVRFPSTGLE